MTRIIEQEYVPISPATRLPETEQGDQWLENHQIRLLNHVFTPQQVTRHKPKDGYKLPYTTFIYSDIKKSGKTGLLGAMHYAWARVFGGEQYALANSKDQATDRAYARMGMFLDYLQRTQPSKAKEIITRNDVDFVELTDPYSSVRAVPVSPGAQAGGFQSLTGWDELWSYERDTATRLYSEMQPIPTIPDRILPDGPEWVNPNMLIKSPSMRIVVTYAGYYGKSDLLYALYEDIIQPDPESGQPTGDKVPGLEDLPVYVSKDGRSIAYWNEVDYVTTFPMMPWQTPAFIEQARAEPINKTNPEEFRRLWQNMWTSEIINFLPIDRIKELQAAGSAHGLHNHYKSTI
jgi:hypothetical protein